jgi:PAS domain-containing protein
VLEERCRSPVTLQRDLKRARIVLLAAVGRLRRHRYSDHGREGLQSKPLPDKRPIYKVDGQTDSEVARSAVSRRIRALDRPAPGRETWRCRRAICLAILA